MMVSVQWVLTNLSRLRKAFKGHMDPGEFGAVKGQTVVVRKDKYTLHYTRLC